ncbi:MAG TPA: aryl-sulfate sulfotransferase, partial [Puia sp.]|nr:aryl-sulfate sulfotransferase [Puia sp.]
MFLLLSTCKKTVTSPTHVIPPNTDTPIITDAGLYSLTIEDSTPPSGKILLSLTTDNNGYLLILDQRGSIIKEKPVGATADNFQQWNIGGQTRYTYFHTEGISTLDGITGTELGYEMICDSNLTVIDTVKILSSGIINNTVQDKLDVHEFILLGDNHYLYETYYEETPTNIPDSLNPAPGVKVAACIIQEVNNGQVVFQWDGAQYPELYTNSVENNNFSDTSIIHDYMHLNSICIDSADNNLIVSFRNLNEIVKLNRQTGQIMWRLGGKNSDYLQTADEMFLRQHYPRLIENDKTLIFVDNGLDSVRAYSRILEFQLDENTKTITSFKSFTVPDNF